MKRSLAAMTAALMMVALFSGSAFAAKPGSDLTMQQWRIWNYMPATSSLWDINKTQSPPQSFPVQPFLSTTTGSFATYLMNNYNVSLTSGQALTATATWTPGTYETRTGDVGQGRIWFQDVSSGPFTSNDYWWYSGSIFDLNSGTGTSSTISAALADTTRWSNICGYLASDTTVYPAQPNCVNGTDPAGSPSAGFASAMQNVKALGLSFGGVGGYAKGIALAGAGPATFTMSSFTVTP